MFFRKKASASEAFPQKAQNRIIQCHTGREEIVYDNDDETCSGICHCGLVICGLSGDEGFKAGSWDEKDEGDFRRDFGRSQGVSDGRI